MPWLHMDRGSPARTPSSRPPSPPNPLSHQGERGGQRAFFPSPLLWERGPGGEGIRSHALTLALALLLVLGRGAPLPPSRPLHKPCGRRSNPTTDPTC